MLDRGGGEWKRSSCFRVGGKALRLMESGIAKKFLRSFDGIFADGIENGNAV